MVFRLIVFSLLVISIFGFSLTNSEVSMLKYQLQMPSLVGNAFGFRMVGTLEQGAFGVVWKVENKMGIFTGQVLSFSSVISKFMETGMIEWSRIYVDVFLLLRF